MKKKIWFREGLHGEAVHACKDLGFDTGCYTAVEECLDLPPGSPVEKFIVLNSVADCNYLDELEKRGFYVLGPGVLFPQSMNGKIRQKEIFSREGIPTPPYLVINRKCIDWDDPFFPMARGEEISLMLKLPGIHGSRGVRPARSGKELESLLHTEFNEHMVFYVEHFIRGRDISMSLIGEERALPLPAVEISHYGGYFDTALKERGFTIKVPAVMEAGHLKRMQGAALKAYGALGGHGIIRCDFRLADDGTPYLLEAVTFAEGLSPHHFSTRSALSMGITFPQLLQKQVHYSYSRKRRRICHFSVS